MTKPNLRLVAANDDTPAASPPAEGIRAFPLSRILAGARTHAARGAGATFTVARYVLFFPLMWLRVLVVGLAGVVGGLCLLGAVLGFFLVPDDYANRATVLWSLMGASFGAFLLSWVYDGLLLWLSPEPIFLDGRVTH